MRANLPIGVFDSGVGGLTVLRALKAALPHESFLYLGDTARLPYGSKSPDTVARYALQAAAVLVERGIKLLVVACNTATAMALPQLQAALPKFGVAGVIGVVEPGAQAACAASKTRRIAVIGTEGTIRGGAYTRAITAIDPHVEVVGRACPLFVALAEEGWVQGPIPTAVAHAYLDTLVTHVDTLVLGCTHFPVLAEAIAEVVGPGVRIVDSAATTAVAVASRLQQRDLLAPADAAATTTMLATDGRERFARVGAGFLGVPLLPDAVEIIDL